MKRETEYKVSAVCLMIALMGCVGLIAMMYDDIRDRDAYIEALEEYKNKSYTIIGKQQVLLTYYEDSKSEYRDQRDSLALENIRLKKEIETYKDKPKEKEISCEHEPVTIQTPPQATNIQVRVKIHTPEEINELYGGNKTVRGFAELKDTDICSIYVPEIKTTEDLEVWGHELVHCIYGFWHGEED